jgi:hypothetical protein
MYLCRTFMDKCTFQHKNTHKKHAHVLLHMGFNEKKFLTKKARVDALHRIRCTALLGRYMELLTGCSFDNTHSQTFTDY